MNGKPKDLDPVLDQAIAEIRDSELDPQTERSVADQVWKKLSDEMDARSAERVDPHSIRDCSGFQALIPAYVRGELGGPKALLLKDHVGECLPCRRALKQAASARSIGRAASPTARRSWISTAGWRIAAAAVFFIAVIGLTINTDLLVIEAGGLVRVERVDGEAFRVTDEGNEPLRVGDEISFADVNGIRTAKGSSASFRMADNSVVEMNERAELAVKQRRPIWSFGEGDPLIELNRGNIIVEAADRDSGQLMVDTDDSRMSVNDSVFAVNRGIKGSRISVIQGELELDQGGEPGILLAGQQSTTRPGLSRVPLEDEIAWSQNLGHHLELLQEVGRVTQEIVEEVEGPRMRYSTNLLDLAPPDTAIYVGIPNMSATLSQAYELLQQKISSNELLSKWWDESVVGSGTDVELQRVMDRIRDYGEHLGEEIAVTLVPDGDGELREPLVISRLTHPADFRAFIEADLEQLAAEGEDTSFLRIFEGELPVAGSEFEDVELNLWLHDGYLAASPDVGGLRRFAQVLEPNGRSFAGSAFHPRLADLYREGVEWVVGVDVESLLAASPDRSDAELERLGLLDLQHVIAVRKSDDDLKQNRVVLTFDQPRKGLVSWLAEPAPMGALDFISPQASFAAAFVMEEPSSVVEQLFGFLKADDPEFEQQLNDFQQEHGIDIQLDVAAALGGEFALALDGPVLPKPSWKLVMEVYNPALLQQTLQVAVDRINDLARDSDRLGLALKEQARGARIYYEIESLDTGISAYYTYADGYLIAAASRALLTRSLQTAKSGISLPDSPSFTSLLPRDGEVNFSAVVYTDLGSILGPLGRTLASSPAQLSADQRTIIEQMGSASKPSLTLAYGETDRIVFVNRSEGGLLGSALRSLLRLDSLLDVQQLLDEAARQGRDAGQTVEPAIEESAKG